MACQHASSTPSIGNFTNPYFYDVEATQDVEGDCGWVSLLDDGTSVRARNTLDAVLRPKCSRHLATLNAWTLNQTQ